MSKKAGTMTTDADSIATRESLLIRLKDWEDQESWRDFYDTYWRLIRGVALRAGLTPEEADDALQDTVTAVAHEIRRFKYEPARGSFKSWLLTQTRWRITAQYRKRQRRVVNVQNDAGTSTGMLDRVPDPASVEVSENLWDEEWHRNLLAVAEDRVKAKVEPINFQIFQLYVRGHWPTSRVAHSLGVSRAKVYLAKHRVESLLKRELRSLVKRESLSPARALRKTP